MIFPLTTARLRLASGLVLFVYVLTHFLNHALGLISLAAMEAAQPWFRALWQNPPAQALLYLSLLAHFALALLAIYRRRRLLTMPRWEAIQLLAGLLIIPQLAEHVIETRGAIRLYGVVNNYAFIIWAFTEYAPAHGVRQGLILLLAWLHGCLGLWFRLKLKRWYAEYATALFAAALVVPLLGLGGFIAAAREVGLRSQDAAWREAMLVAANLPDDASLLTTLTFAVRVGFVALLAATLLARMIRRMFELSRGIVRVSYPDGRDITVPPGTTVLEASQALGVPHACVCGGRGRCSTCRVRIAVGSDAVAPPSAQEARVLLRIGAAPNIRLACQLAPRADVSVFPLLPANASARDGWQRPEHLHGREMEIAVLFADIRGFTTLSEKRLPYDVVFILNRYFREMGQAVERAGGHLDKFLGDGVMALFGIESGPHSGARAALEAARGMAQALERLNRSLAHDIASGLKIGIGIHLGPAIVGEMGYGGATGLTAIGDTINTASRLESMTKDFGAELVLSEAVEKAAGIALPDLAQHAVKIRGRAESILIRAVPRVSDLPEFAAEPRQSIAASAR